MKKRLSQYLIASTLALGTAVPSWAASNSDVVGTYNDQKVTRGEVLEKFQTIYGGQSPLGNMKFDDLPANVQEEIVKNLIISRLVYTEASAAETQDKPEVKKLLAATRQDIINREYLLGKAKKNISESSLKDRYKTFKKEWGNKEEVKARHILVDSEDTAKKLQNELKKGADFEKLAKENSKDNSKNNGGDLGYFPRGRMVQPFEDAAFNLKKGQVSDPVQTDFGWHLIKLEDRRKVPAPSFDDVKPRLEQEMVNEWVSNHLNALMEKAKLEVTLQPKDPSQTKAS